MNPMKIAAAATAAHNSSRSRLPTRASPQRHRKIGGKYQMMPEEGLTAKSARASTGFPKNTGGYLASSGPWVDLMSPGNLHVSFAQQPSIPTNSPPIKS